MPAPITDSKAGEISEEDAHKRFKRIDAKLRRLCEQKPSGKLNVPRALHEMWLKGGQERDELRAAFLNDSRRTRSPWIWRVFAHSAHACKHPKQMFQGFKNLCMKSFCRSNRQGAHVYIYIYVYMYKPRALTQTVVVVLQTLGI